MAKRNRRRSDGGLLQALLILSVLAPFSLAAFGSLVGAIVVSATNPPAPVLPSAPDVSAKLKNRDVKETRAEITVVFSDADVGDTHSSTIDWGDGTVETFQNVTSPFATSHSYAVDEAYVISASVTDQGVLSDTDTLNLFVGGLTPSQGHPGRSRQGGGTR